MATMKAYKVSTLPSTFEANAIYYVAKSPNVVEIYVANNTGTSVRKLDQTQDILGHFMATSETAPDLATTTYLLWWAPLKGTLYVRYTNPGTGQSQWVEAAPATDFPAFAGNGTADTMSHSDHWHTSLRIVSEW